ncbi:MAG: type I-E CRISPR-associated protein Cas7/Cse4/CasC [Candidatus Helarchaeota archaeon]
MLIEFHMIQNHAPSNLNRDDTGSPKSCFFGDYPRARISSQCLKRTIRKSEFFQELNKKYGKSYRTRKLPELIYKRLIENGIEENEALIIADRFKKLGKKSSSSKSTEKSKQIDKSDLSTQQIMFFSDKEIQNIVDLLLNELKDKTADKIDMKKIEKKLGSKSLQPITPDIALFGRMVTSDAFLDIEASIQVAHAISTNKLDREFDFFTAVDDFAVAGSLQEQGAGMVGDIEFNSACYYKYFSLDATSFLENMTGKNKEFSEDEITLLTDVIKAFLKAAVYVTPTGKQNTFAAHQLPDLILVEVKPKKIPISYANAFLKPARPTANQDIIDVSISKLCDYISTISKKFNVPVLNRLWFCTRDISLEGTDPCENIDELESKLAKLVGEGINNA